MTTRSVLERLPGVVITAAIVLLAGTMAMGMSPRFRAMVRGGPVLAYEVGDRFEEAAFDGPAITRRLVVVSGPNCGASERAHAFLSEAVKAAAASGIAVWLYTAEAADPAIGDYASRLGIPRDRIVPVDLTATKISLMPTLVLLDGKHAVLHFWETPADEATNARILLALRAGTPQ